MDRVITQQTRHELTELDRPLKLIESGEVRITHPQKAILKKAFKELTGDNLNMTCGSCVANALRAVKRHLDTTANPFVNASQNIQEAINKRKPRHNG